jgi:23S rRNA (guanine745-N1)-methyltransferase
VPSVIPAVLARVAADLRCPVCARPLAATGRALRCARAHSFDPSRHGYLTLMAPRRRRAAGDDAAMVAARGAVLDAKHFAPLTEALVATAVRVTAPDARIVVDAGAGTGHHLAAVLDVLPNARGVAFDASAAALRQAARAHPRIAAIGGDVWHHVPVGDAAAGLVLNVFAPRNADEFARVLHRAGTLVVATPATDHLQELAALHRVRIDPRKRERLYGELERVFELADVRHVAWDLRLTRLEAAAVVHMGPAAHHLSPTVERRLRALPPTLAVTAAVDVHVFRRSRSPRRPARRPAPRRERRDAGVPFRPGRPAQRRA